MKLIIKARKDISKLIPVKITDKRGNIKTVYVSPDKYKKMEMQKLRRNFILKLLNERGQAKDLDKWMNTSFDHWEIKRLLEDWGSYDKFREYQKYFGRWDILQTEGKQWKNIYGDKLDEIKFFRKKHWDANTAKRTVNTLGFEVTKKLIEKRLPMNTITFLASKIRENKYGKDILNKLKDRLKINN